MSNCPTYHGPNRKHNARAEPSRAERRYRIRNSRIGSLWRMFNKQQKKFDTRAHTASPGSETISGQKRRGFAVVNHAELPSKRLQVRLHLAAASLHQIPQLAKDKFAKFLACQPTTTDRHVILRTRWQPPPSDFMKINFDGAVFPSENRLGIGVVIRDSAGLVIASCSQRLSQAYRSDEVEAFAAAKALSFAAEISISKAVMEGDSLTIIKALSSDQRSLSSFGPLIDDAKFSSVNFDQLRYSHVKRECNFAAHSLAKFASNISDFQVWMEDVPPQLSHVIQADLAGFS
ncbi:hypothetical protein SO802_014725 [Lithocarpus litseifolius]|uniref:RNase H type-1 domain-containing protein n=1 Tax=Lithocarpus litseifolius TaxID=425828 RepID=A0AAW2CSB7_9ROSI